FLFRLLDTFKPYPAGFVQKYKGSVGIMCDDIIAALYANLILQFVWRLNS
ncbi:MAG: phosphatidylglycerophosphatase A, partial [Candidatus Omnitrophica bacterium]|nr:phosphatidylglycerophosphatase A [Candidatus Omnitrophota bacterium]